MAQQNFVRVKHSTYQSGTQVGSYFLEFPFLQLHFQSENISFICRQKSIHCNYATIQKRKKKSFFC